MEWFENVDRYAHFEAEQFAYSMLTRSQRIPHENLRLRDADYVGSYEHWIAARAFAQAGMPRRRRRASIPPMLTPFRARGVVLKNRIVVSPMAQYSARDGIPGDYHLVHLGARAMGGAGMVFAEMTCVSPDARITPGCPGLWNDAQRDAWRRIVDFVHAETDAKIAMQLGHAGAKGSTCVPWDGGEDRPLPRATGRSSPPARSSTSRACRRPRARRRRRTWRESRPISSPRPVVRRKPASTGSSCTARTAICCRRFISPLTNRRDDEYGGDLRRPLPLSARSVRGDPRRVARGQADQRADLRARLGGRRHHARRRRGDRRLFKAAGADLMDCSSGQVVPDAKPVYGRMYQTPFADRIRNEAGIATIAVGAIFEADHANSIIAAGRADLCAIARPHLANPAWTLTEAAKLGYPDIEWPKQYRTAKTQLERNIAARAGRPPPPMPG